MLPGCRTMRFRHDEAASRGAPRGRDPDARSGEPGAHLEDIAADLVQMVRSTTADRPARRERRPLDRCGRQGAFFQIKMTPNQIRMTGYEEDAFLIFFFRFDSNSPIRVKP